MFILERVISVIAPHTCIRCGVEGSLLCRWCAPEVFTALPPRCYKCYGATKDSLVCQRCRPSVRLKHVWAATDYDGFAKRLVQAFKYERAQAAAAIIASSMHTALPYLAGALVVHVPTATSRVRSRGYDHTGLLARALAKQLNLESAPALARLGQSRQVGSKRKQRHQQLSSAFRVTNSSKIAGRHILLVDDIVTTGSTLESAANALKAGGAKTVDAVVFAQSQ